MTRAVLLWTASSALLILAVAALRALLGRRMGAGVKYALWGVVLLRLLVPVQLFTVPVPADWTKTLTQSAAVGGGVPIGSGAPAAGAPVTVGPDDPIGLESLSGGGRIEDTGHADPGAPDETGRDEVIAPYAILWLAGAAATAAAFLVSNLSFYRRLRRVRRPLCSFSREKKNQKELQVLLQSGGQPQFAPGDETDCVIGNGIECPLPVYLAEGLPSPCLFGLFRPAVYVTPGAAADPDILRHVLAHEYTHFRHGDHIWNVLRGAALALHWWNPLVWLAAALSRRDSELACDEGTLRRLGEGERFAYGRTLLLLIGQKPRGAGLLSCATTMTGDGRSVAQRVKRIARAPKRWLWAAALAVLLAVLAAACAFGQGEEPADPSSGDPQLPWAEGADSLRYVRDKGGFPDEFAIRLHRDGSFAYYEGSLSSFIGMGSWTREGDVICLADERGEAHSMYHYFTLEEDALIFQAGESDRFLYVDVADGERFSLDPDPPEWDWFDVHGDSPSPTPEQAVSMEFSFSLNEGASGVDITGLDCESAGWCAEPMSGYVIAGRRDLIHAEQLGCLTVEEPRFLGEAFAAGNGKLLCIYYPEEGPLLFLGFDEHDNGLLKPVTASVYAFVDLSDGTVREKELSGFDDQRAGAFSDEFLVKTAQRLALLIQDTAWYYDQALAAAPVVADLTDFSAPMPDEGQTFVLTYKGKETRFSGYWYHMPERAQTLGTLIDLDGDGKDEIVVILSQGGGTGAWSDGLYVFDGDTLEQFDTAGVAQMILDSIRSMGDAENFYLTGPGGLNVAISKEDVRRGYEYGDIPMDDTLAMGNIVEFRVENGAVHCNLPCSSYFTINYIGSLDVTLDFSRIEGFRCVKTEYLPYEDNDSDPYEAARNEMDQMEDRMEQAKDEMEQAKDKMDEMKKELEKAAKEAEWERQQMVEYQAVGVTMDGKNYYYQGQLVNIFLDIRANGSFYTLDTNPAGTVNVKILRDGNDNITGAAYMTEAEAAELLNDMRGPDGG